MILPVSPALDQKMIAPTTKAIPAMTQSLVCMLRMKSMMEVPSMNEVSLYASRLPMRNRSAPAWWIAPT